jgi:DNA-binding transcriptional LysR family regulator
LLPEAQTILRMLHAATDRAQRATSEKRGVLHVGLFGSGTLGVVPQVLTQFKDEHPTIDVSLHYAQTPAQVQALRQGRVVIVFERMLPWEPDIETELVTSEPLMLAVSSRHRFAKQKSVHVSELRTETLRIGTLPKTAASTIELCRRHGFEPHFAPPASDVIMMTLLTAIGTEVALVPWSMTHLHFPGITYLPLDGAIGAYNDLYCYYLRDERSPLLSSVLETVRTMRSSGFFQLTNHFEKG